MFTNVINRLNHCIAMHRYDLHPRLAADKVLARGPKAASTRPHTRGRLLIAAALAVVALAAVGMSETAMAQTTEEIKIGVLSACSRRAHPA